MVGTGDNSHPGWFVEIEKKLVPAESGLFKLNDRSERLADAPVFPYWAPSHTKNEGLDHRFGQYQPQRHKGHNAFSFLVFLCAPCVFVVIANALNFPKRFGEDLIPSWRNWPKLKGTRLK